jgi:hypothetical protein
MPALDYRYLEDSWLRYNGASLVGENNTPVSPNQAFVVVERRQKSSWDLRPVPPTGFRGFTRWAFGGFNGWTRTLLIVSMSPTAVSGVRSI